MIGSLVALACGEAADVASTAIGLHLGAQEGVASTALVLDSGGMPRLILLKLLVVLLAALLAAVVFKLGRPRWLWLPMQALWLGSACFTFAVAGHNLGLVGVG